MKTTVLISLWLALGWACKAEQVLAEYDWRKLAESGRLSGGAAVSEEGKTGVKISNTNNSPMQTPLLTITNPPVTKNLYAIVGEVKYAEVKGDGYLEMRNGCVKKEKPRSISWAPSPQCEQFLLRS